MSEVVEFALLGLAGGGVITILALGIVVIYRGSGVLNLAQGAMAMAGAFLYVELQDSGWSKGAALVVTVLSIGLFGAIVYLTVIRSLSHASPLTRLVATLGVLTVLQAGATIIYKSKVLALRTPLPIESYEWFGIRISSQAIFLFGIALVLTVGLYMLTRFTIAGLLVDAVAENERSVAAAGWSPDLIAALTWGIGGMLAGLGGVFAASLLGLQVNSLTYIIIPAMAAALVGGFSSFWLVLAGGLGLGMVQSLSVRYIHELPDWVPSIGIADAIAFLLIMAIIVIRGRGLPLRGHLVERLPELGTGRVKASVLLSLVAIGVGLVLVLPNDWVDAVSVTLIGALLMLSVVVLTGYTGQLSLGQVAIAGIGTLVTAQLVVSESWPFEVALVAGVLGAIFFGLLFALPALRTRGVNLSIVTLGLGTAVWSVIFQNSDYTGGFTGLRVGPQTLFGISIDPLRDPEHYALFVLAAFSVVVLMVTNLRRGPAGRRMIAVRGNERAAASLGVNVVEAKLAAFAIAAGIAGLGGILLGFKSSAVLFGVSFDPLGSINIVSLAVVGGVAYAIGPLFSASLIAGSIGALAGSKLLPGLDEWLALISGFMLIAILLFSPDGLAAFNVKAFKRMFMKRSVNALQRAPEAALQATRVQETSLVVEDMSVRFGGIVAVDGVSLHVATGEIVGLIGPNGAGKTTLVDAVTGFTRCDAGTVHLGDKRIDTAPAFRRARSGLSRSFQTLELFDDLTVLDNLRAAADSHVRAAYLTNMVWPTNPPLSDTLYSAIQELDLVDEMGTRVDEMPTGRRRLVAIARALASDPSILMLDEPMSGLDDVESAELGRVVRSLATGRGLGVLLIEHDMSVIMSICDRVVVLDFGRKIAEGTPEEIRRDASVIAAYLGSDDDSVVIPDRDRTPVDTVNEKRSGRTPA